MNARCEGVSDQKQQVFPGRSVRSSYAPPVACVVKRHRRVERINIRNLAPLSNQVHLPLGSFFVGPEEVKATLMEIHLQGSGW